MPEFSDRAATPAEYAKLREITGLGARSLGAARIGLDATLFGVWVRSGQDLIGMGRVIGDGGCFVQITDVSVAPDFQGQGFGSRILARLLAWCDSTLPSGCYISLIADEGAEQLYQRAGFEYRTGMARTVP